MKTNYNGSILITTLIVIAICTTAALYIHERTTKSYSAITNLQSDYQGAIYAMTLTKALETLFRYDQTPNSDGKSDLWNIIPSIPIDKGFANISIKPLNSKFPINTLALKDNDTNKKRYEDGFKQLLQSIDLNNSIDNIQQNIKDWNGSSEAPSSLRIDENNGPYNIKGAPLNTLAELYYIPKLENDYKKLSEYISIGESNYKINLNLASKEVMLAIIPELGNYVDQIISKREKEDFTNISNIYDIMGSDAKDVFSSVVTNLADVKSSLFYIKLELNILDEIRFYHILVERNGANIKVIKYIEGGNIEYF